MARFYTYINPAEVEAQFDKDDKEDYLEKSNPYAKLDSVSQTQMWMSGSPRSRGWPQDVPRGLSPGGRTLCWVASDGEGFRTVDQTKSAAFSAAGSEPETPKEVLLFVFREVLFKACTHTHFYNRVHTLP